LNLQVEIESRVDEKEWNQKLTKSNASTTYQISHWGKVYEFYNSKPFFVTVRNSTGEIVGQLLSIVHNEMLWDGPTSLARFVGTKLNLRNSLTWLYGPIIYDEDHIDEIISKILQALDQISVKNKVVIIKGSSHPFLSKFSNQLFKQAGYQIRSWATYITDLKQGEDFLYAGLDKKTRYDIRKSEENGLEFVVANDRSALDEFVELKVQEKLRGGKKTKADSPHFYDSRWEHLHKNGYEKLFLTKYKGEPVAGILNVIFNGNVSQHGVSVSSARQPLGGPFLTWNTMKWCREMKYLTYDMGGINPSPENDKEKSINFYKSKWGGKKVYYMKFTKVLDAGKWKISAVLKDPRKIRSILD